MAQLENWPDQSSVPQKVLKLTGQDQKKRLLAKKLPAFWEANKDNEKLNGNIKATLSGFFQENYYALVLMDGDNMGAWLSGSDDYYRLAYEDSWHSKLRAGVDNRYREQLKTYMESKRYPSPARHIAISDALNGFSLDLARYVVENLFKGKLLYSGGDDVMAMVAVDDLLPMMLLLRLVYSGIFPVKGDEQKVWSELFKQDKPVFKIANGYVFHNQNNKLYRVMGHKATASTGAVIAHHTAPLGQVLKALRSAEHRAKQSGRDAFAIDLIKRSGGAVKLTCPWFKNNDHGQSLLDSPLGALNRLRLALAQNDVSRRSAYIAQDWLKQLPPKELFGDDNTLYQSLLVKSLQSSLLSETSFKVEDLAETLVQLGLSLPKQNPIEFISNFIGVAEFLGRECRSGVEL